MTHEFKKIIAAYKEQHTMGVTCVLASVVGLEGSSYRRPGVRMLLAANGKIVGAVSGGCVEKEIAVQAVSVFKTGIPKVITYDGRYRLGCEGILQILIEPFAPTEEGLHKIETILRSRDYLEIHSYYLPEFKENSVFGSTVVLAEEQIPLGNTLVDPKDLDCFKQKLAPCLRLLIIGGEHDAVKLCEFATLTGWEVTVVVDPRDAKHISDFPGAIKLIETDAAALEVSIDKQTAVVLMSHSFSKDLSYLIKLKDCFPAYFGLLGPAKRRENLFAELWEQQPNISEDFMSQIKGPAGLDLGAETPEEICLSILSEILTVIRRKDAKPLLQKKDRIHL